MDRAASANPLPCEDGREIQTRKSFRTSHRDLRPASSNFTLSGEHCRNSYFRVRYFSGSAVVCLIDASAKLALISRNSQLSISLSYTAP